MRSLTLILLLLSGLVLGQDNPAPKPDQEKAQADAGHEPRVAEIIQVKTLNGDAFDRLLTLLSVFPAQFKGDSQMRTILVYGSKDVVAQMRRVVEELDRPGSEAAIGRNIDATITLLRCSAKAPAAPEALPPDMESVARQLRTTMQCKDVQLWDVVPMRLQEGKEATERLRLPGELAEGYFGRATFTIRPDAVYRKDQGRYVRFGKVQLDFQVPYVTGAFPGGNKQFGYSDLSLHTSGDFMEGQKTVLGKVSGASDEDSVFAVITLKVLD